MAVLIPITVLSIGALTVFLWIKRKQNKGSKLGTLENNPLKGSNLGSSKKLSDNMDYTTEQIVQGDDHGMIPGIGDYDIKKNGPPPEYKLG